MTVVVSLGLLLTLTAISCVGGLIMGDVVRHGRRGGMRLQGAVGGIGAGHLEAEVAEAWSNLFEEHDNDAMNVLFTPCPDECPEPVPLLSPGQPNPLPSDLPAGVLLRNGPNPQPGHVCGSFLDGDGMIHAITFPPQDSSSSSSSSSPSYSRTYVRARGFSKEEARCGEQLFKGTLVAPRGLPMLQHLVSNAWNAGGQVQKDTVNTALSHHAGRTLALMEQSRPSELRVSRSGRVSTVAADSDLGGAIAPVPVLGGALSAHSRTDPASGDLVSVSYSTALPPFLRVDVFSGSDGKLKSSVGVDTPAPVMVHDLAITARHTVLLDLPMTVRVERTLLDRFPVEYEPAAGARVGVLRRGGGGGGGGGGEAVEEVRWADVEPCVVLHTANAFEEPMHDGPHGPSSQEGEGGGGGGGVRVTLTALRSLPKGPQSYICSYTPAFLYRWVLEFPSSSSPSSGANAKGAKGAKQTGRCVKEQYLNALPVEFPMCHPSYHGRSDCRFVWAITPCSAGGPLAHGYATPQEGILIDGLVQMDLATGRTLAEWRSSEQPASGHASGSESGGAGGECRHYVVSEPTIVPKVHHDGGDSAEEAREDDAYILLIMSRVKARGAGDEDGGCGERCGAGSELFVFDAARISDGPCATLPLPTDVPYGLHSTFVPWKDATAP